MKERIVIKDEFWVKHFQEREKEFYEEDLCSGGNPEEWWHYEKEQVPETFEELKKLCEDLEDKDVFITSAGDCIEYHGLQFWVSGAVCHETDKFYSIKSDRTPQQMWQIIKNLIGEE